MQRLSDERFRILKVSGFFYSYLNLQCGEIEPAVAMLSRSNHISHPPSPDDDGAAMEETSQDVRGMTREKRWKKRMMTARLAKRDLVWFATIVATVCLTWFSRPAYHDSGARNDIEPWLPQQMHARGARGKGMMPEESSLLPSLTVALISNNREASLRRLCNSLLKADHTAVHVFFSRIDIIFNLEASSSDSIVAFARNFHWPHGSKTVRKRSKQGGLIVAVSESWYPSSNKDYGCLLEDDIEVSPHYLSWITKVLVALDRAPDPRVVGISLYSPRITESTNPKRPFDSTQLVNELLGQGPGHESPYMMQTPCSWGAVFFPDHWHQFLGYLNLRHGRGDGSPMPDVEIPGSRTNGWKKSWKKFHFELLYLRGQYMVYPNFEGQQSLSTNHMERGVHITKGGSSEHKKNEFQVPLLQDGTRVQRLELQNVSHLPVFDLFGEPWLREEELMLTLHQMASDPRSLKTTNLATVWTNDILRVGDEVSSLTGSLLISKTARFTDGPHKGHIMVHYGTQQPDGNFVIYRDIKGSLDDSALSVAWDARSYVGKKEHCKSLCYSFRLSLAPSGSLRVEQIHEQRMSDAKKRRQKMQPRVLFSSPPDITPGATHYAKLEADGRLVVYRQGSDDDCAATVWESDVWIERAAAVPKVVTPPRCQTPSVEPSRCETFPWEVPPFLTDSSSITLMISAHDGFEVLAKHLVYYSSSPLISTIVVLWHHVRIRPPRDSRYQGTLIRFEKLKRRSASGRFAPRTYISTEAVLMVDEDAKVHLQDVDNLFATWKKNRRSLVGFSPRGVDDVADIQAPRHGNGTAGWFKWAASPSAHLTHKEQQRLRTLSIRAQSPEDLISQGSGYSLMLAGTLMMHRDYLQLYTCGGRSDALDLEVPAAFNKLRELITEYGARDATCEDIGMNFVASAALHALDPIEGVAPLFVRPLHHAGGDHQQMKKTRASKQLSFATTIRSDCLNAFNRAFFNATGINIATQRRVVKDNWRWVKM